jgi:hypothetical protein
MIKKQQKPQNKMEIKFTDPWLNKVSEAVKTANVNPQVWVDADIWDTMTKYRILVKFGIINEIV